MEPTIDLYFFPDLELHNTEYWQIYTSLDTILTIYTFVLNSNSVFEIILTFFFIENFISLCPKRIAICILIFIDQNFSSKVLHHVSSWGQESSETYELLRSQLENIQIYVKYFFLKHLTFLYLTFCLTVIYMIYPSN